MKKFIIKSVLIVLVTCCLAVLAGLTYKGVGNMKTNYMAAIIDKHHRCDSVPSPRIFFVGGSNVAFGINSDTIEEALGRPVINLGLHAGLGLDFMFNEAMDVAKKGDIVVISPEYFLNENGQFDLLWYTSMIYPHAKKYFKSSLTGYFNLYISNFRKKMNQLFDIRFVGGLAAPEYQRSAFGVRGDLQKHLDLKHNADLKNRFVFENKKYTGVNRINRFADDAKASGIRVFFIYPPCPQTDYNKNIEVLTDYQQQLSSELHCKILGSAGDFAYNDTLFYDTVYHLLRKGRAMRSKQIIELLKAELQDGKNIN